MRAVNEPVIAIVHTGSAAPHTAERERERARRPSSAAYSRKLVAKTCTKNIFVATEHSYHLLLAYLACRAFVSASCAAFFAARSAC